MQALPAPGTFKYKLGSGKFSKIARSQMPLISLSPQCQEPLLHVINVTCGSGRSLPAASSAVRMEIGPGRLCTLQLPSREPLLPRA